jgi:hypothetical protein
MNVSNYLLVITQYNSLADTFHFRHCLPFINGRFLLDIEKVVNITVVQCYALSLIYGNLNF